MHSDTVLHTTVKNEKKRRISVTFLSFFFLLFSTVCYAAEPEPAPQTEALESEGMLSPSSEKSSESVFGSASAKESFTDEKLSVLLTNIQSMLPAQNGVWSVFVRDLINESEGSINDQPMQAASLIKLFIMGAVYENYEALTQQYGQSSINSWLHSMITVSDNDAANSLVNCLGGGNSAAGMDAVNIFCENHGYLNTSMGRLLLQGTENGDNYTSVSDCGHFLDAVYDDESTEFSHADEMFDLLSAQTRTHKIPSQLPEGVHTANKTGELSNVENDAAIIYDTDNDLILVFMSQNLSEVGSAQSTIASISRQIYDYYNP